MKVPTTGTSVFSSVTIMDTNSVVNSSAPVVDLAINKFWYLNDNNFPVTGTNYFVDRLRGLRSLESTDTAAEKANQTLIAGFDRQSGMRLTIQNTGFSNFFWMFRRAPGFFDEVCYTGNSAGANNQNHNLGVVPEMCILKARSGASAVDNWQVVHKNDGVTAVTLALNLTNGTIVTSTMSANFTSTVFKTADATWPFTRTNFNGDTYVAYLFATCPGVSKVFSYTGNGSSQTINCGFTGGARLVIVKRTDSTGNWLVVDTARGLVSGNDPTLYLNSTAAEVTGIDWIDPDSSGFIVNQEATMNANVNGGTYIGIAVA
jgi:hypothetical protein